MLNTEKKNNTNYQILNTKTLKPIIKMWLKYEINFETEIFLRFAAQVFLPRNVARNWFLSSLAVVTLAIWRTHGTQPHDALLRSLPSASNSQHRSKLWPRHSRRRAKQLGKKLNKQARHRRDISFSLSLQLSLSQDLRCSPWQKSLILEPLSLHFDTRNYYSDN